MTSSNKLKNGAENEEGAKLESYNNGDFAGNNAGAMHINKNKIKEVAFIVLAWLFALALVYMVLVKISILFQQR